MNTVLIGILVLITAYYAWQTHRQANLLNKQLKAIAEQRRRSIQPSLQVNHISYWYQKSKILGTHKEASIPGIELQISNVGTGPALDLEIWAWATIFVTRGDPLEEGQLYRLNEEGQFCRLNWELLKVSKNSYLERTLKPTPFRLNLVNVDRIGINEGKREMGIKFKFRDIDQSPLTDRKTIELGRDISPLRYSADSPNIIPGEPGYPETIMISI